MIGQVIFFAHFLLDKQNVQLEKTGIFGEAKPAPPKKSV